MLVQIYIEMKMNNFGGHLELPRIQDVYTKVICKAWGKIDLQSVSTGSSSRRRLIWNCSGGNNLSFDAIVGMTFLYFRATQKFSYGVFWCGEYKARQPVAGNILDEVTWKRLGYRRQSPNPNCTVPTMRARANRYEKH